MISLWPRGFTVWGPSWVHIRSCTSDGTGGQDKLSPTCVLAQPPWPFLLDSYLTIVFHTFVSSNVSWCKCAYMINSKHMLHRTLNLTISAYHLQSQVGNWILAIKKSQWCERRGEGLPVLVFIPTVFNIDSTTSCFQSVEQSCFSFQKRSFQILPYSECNADSFTFNLGLPQSTIFSNTWRWRNFKWLSRRNPWT